MWKRKETLDFFFFLSTECRRTAVEARAGLDLGGHSLQRRAAEHPHAHAHAASGNHAAAPSPPSLRSLRPDLEPYLAPSYGSSSTSLLLYFLGQSNCDVAVSSLAVVGAGLSYPGLCRGHCSNVEPRVCFGLRAELRRSWGWRYRLFQHAPRIIVFTPDSERGVPCVKIYEASPLVRLQSVRFSVQSGMGIRTVVRTLLSEM